MIRLKAEQLKPGMMITNKHGWVKGLILAVLSKDHLNVSLVVLYNESSKVHEWKWVPTSETFCVSDQC